MRKILIIVLTVFMSIVIYAQGKIESPYSRFGIGDIFNSSSSRSMGVGGASLALPSSGHINNQNPSSFIDIDSLTFIFDFGFNGGVRLYEIDNPKLSGVKSDMQLSYMKFGFKLKKWWATSFGVLPYSNVAYDITSYDNVSYEVPISYRLAGNGGFNRVFWGNAFSPVKNFSVGINASYLFGSLNKVNRINFDDDSGAYLNTLEQNTYTVNDFMFDFGARYTININDKKKIYLAAIYNLNSPLNATQSRIIFNSLSTGGSAVIDTVFKSSEIDGIISIPQKIGAGIAFQTSDKFLVAMDYQTQNWSEAEFFGKSDSLKNSNNYSLGIEYFPIGQSGYAYRYSQSIKYRAGLYYNNTFLNVNPEADQINDFGISFGLGLPLKRSKTSFNLALQIGQRGSVINNLIKENYFIFALNFNLADTWFIKRKFD